jgi:hypothetical protein
MNPAKIKNECRRPLHEEGRFDLFRFVLKEIYDLKSQGVEDITSELVISNLLERYPENTYKPS